MLLLCSNGLSSPKLITHMKDYTHGCSSAALVVTADPVYKEKNYHVDRCIKELESLSLSVSLFDLDHQSPDLLLDYDAVEFIGGNPYYLLHSIRQSNAVGALRTIAEEKILIGWSAAVFVFGPTLELVNEYSPEMNVPGLTDLTGLCLTDTQVLPHYSKFLKRFEHFEETCLNYENQHNVEVIRLNDGDGVFISNGGMEICRG